MGNIIRATAADGMIKMAVLTAADIVERARQIHSCSPTASAALGRTLCAASLLGNSIKEENGSLTIRIAGDGPLAGIVAVSDSTGNVRGYCGNPQADLPTRADGKLDVGGIVGRNGTFTLSRDICLKEPYIGSVELVSGEIAEDLSSYLYQSEQIPSACALGVLVDTDFTIRAAGGFIAQLMPGADEELINQLERNVRAMEQLTTILDSKWAEEVFAQVLSGFDYHIVSQEYVEYRCSCSREKVEKALICLSWEDLQELASEKQDVEVCCQFCEKRYCFSPEEILTLQQKSTGEDTEPSGLRSSP